MELLAITFDANEWGTVAAWVGAVGAITVGLVAAGFGALAWKETKRATNATEQATTWAKIAAEAQQRANALKEAELVPTINVALENMVTGSGEEVPAIPQITISLSDDSPALIWIRSFASNIAVFYDADETSNWSEVDDDTHEPFNDSLPQKLLPSHKIAAPDPYHTLYQGRLLGNASFIYCDLTYSYTENGPLNSINGIRIDLDARSRNIWIY